MSICEVMLACELAEERPGGLVEWQANGGCIEARRGVCKYINIARNKIDVGFVSSVTCVFARRHVFSAWQNDLSDAGVKCTVVQKHNTPFSIEPHTVLVMTPQTWRKTKWIHEICFIRVVWDLVSHRTMNISLTPTCIFNWIIVDSTNMTSRTKHKLLNHILGTQNVKEIIQNGRMSCPKRHSFPNAYQFQLAREDTQYYNHQHTIHVLDVLYGFVQGKVAPRVPPSVAPTFSTQHVNITIPDTKLYDAILAMVKWNLHERRSSVAFQWYMLHVLEAVVYDTLSLHPSNFLEGLNIFNTTNPGRLKLILNKRIKGDGLFWEEVERTVDRFLRKDTTNPCPICMEEPRGAMCVPVCGHTLCCGCAKQHESLKCPTCRHPMSPKTTIILHHGVVNVSARLLGLYSILHRSTWTTKAILLLVQRKVVRKHIMHFLCPHKEWCVKQCPPHQTQGTAVPSSTTTIFLCPWQDIIGIELQSIAFVVAYDYDRSTDTLKGILSQAGFHGMLYIMRYGHTFETTLDDPAYYEDNTPCPINRLYRYI